MPRVAAMIFAQASHAVSGCAILSFSSLPFLFPPLCTNLSVASDVQVKHLVAAHFYPALVSSHMKCEFAGGFTA